MTAERLWQVYAFGSVNYSIHSQIGMLSEKGFDHGTTLRSALSPSVRAPRAHDRT
jgi:hypothetical protein